MNLFVPTVRISDDQLMAIPTLLGYSERIPSYLLFHLYIYMYL
jgi:hypothetical protein